MRSWNDYKQYAKSVDPNAKRDIEEMESLALIVGAIIEQRNSLGLSQRDLAEKNAECRNPLLQESSP